LLAAQKEFAAAAGVPPDAGFLQQAAGRESALAIYDIGKLQFAYVSHISNSDAIRSALWQSRASFEPRDAGGQTFFVRTDTKSDRVVAFAVSGDFLLLATREDLLAGMLTLLSGGNGPRLSVDNWYSSAVTAAGKPGDLRLVLNLEELVTKHAFRSYWIQRNTNDLKVYSSGVVDLRREGKEFREERVLLRKPVIADSPAANANLRSPSVPGEASISGSQAVADLGRLVHEHAGFYRIQADPSPADVLALLQDNLLAPHLGPAPAGKLAPQVSLSEGGAGSSSDLESRIDIAPPGFIVQESAASDLSAFLAKSPVNASLQLQFTQTDPLASFVRIRTALVLLAASDWDLTAVSGAIQSTVQPGLSTQSLGVAWQKQGSGSAQLLRLDGLFPMVLAVAGKYLVLSSDRDSLAAVLSRMDAASTTVPAIYMAGFNHQRERGNFAHWTGILDQAYLQSSYSTPAAGREPEFFSRNLSSLSKTLSGVQSISIQQRHEGGVVRQTVIYHWER
jgi:hypothetical protein